MATSEREALAMLDARGLFPLHIAPAKSVRRGGGKRVKSRNLTAFYAQLADLLHSGVPLLRSLDLLERLSSQAASPRCCVKFALASPTAWVYPKRWPNIRAPSTNWR